ncbi:MAG: hypothetical protein ACKV2U_34095 [Bryobacteraceae bacterium]
MHFAELASDPLSSLYGQHVPDAHSDTVKYQLPAFRWNILEFDRLDYGGEWDGGGPAFA